MNSKNSDRLQDAAAEIRNAVDAYYRVAKEVLGDEALLAAAEHIRTQGLAAATAGQKLGFLLFQLQMLKEYEAGNIESRATTERWERQLRKVQEGRSDT